MRTKHDQTLKRVIFLLTLLALLNPVILFLISGKIILSVVIPILFVIIFFILRENKKLNPLSLIIFNLILVISFFIHVEAIFTFRFSEYIIEDLYVVRDKYYFNRPYLNQNFQDKEFNVQYKTNIQGFRIGAEDDPEVIVDKTDWLFIGDSYTQGAQVQYEELFTSKLFDYFTDKIILNAGISGMGIADEYNYYINEGKNLKPQKVFLQICNFNDFMNVGERSTGFSDYLMHYSNFARFVLYGFKYSNPAELSLGRWTEPFYPNEKSNEAYNIFYKIQSAQKKNDLALFSYFLNKFNDAVIKNGGELIVIQIPTKEQVYYKYFEEVVSSFEIDVSKLDMQYPNRFLDSLCRKSNIKHLDLLNDFINTESDLFFQYDEHLSTNGHQQIASSIFNFLNHQNQKKHEQDVISLLNLGDRYPNFTLGNCNTLVYQSFRGGNMEIFIADSLMNNPTRITWNRVDESHPSISPDGMRLVFTEGNQAEHETKVVVMNIDGSERRYITFGNYFGAIPSFSRDGTKIAYAEWRKDAKYGLMTNPYIVVYDFESESKKFVTGDKFEHWRPIFSLDGNSLFYISKELNNRFDIFYHSLVTNQKTNLTKTDYEEWDIALSPDGKHLAYAGNIEGDNWDLFLLEIANGKLKQLTNSTGNEWDPSFSPCNNYLYYSATYGFRNGIFRLKIN